MTLTVHPVVGMPEVSRGDDVGALLHGALTDSGLELEKGDIVVVTHKVVSKAEGAVVPLDGDDEDASYLQIVVDEAEAVVRRRGDLIIARTRHGWICANAGVDRSNAAPGTAVLLPRDPDRSAHTIRMSLRALTGVDVAVVVSDTFGRPWRRGQVDVAIGISGMEAILDLRGTRDAAGRDLAVTEIAIADEIAAAADLVMGKAANIPAALLRGLVVPPGDGRASDLIRPTDEEMFL